jgi:DNA polymerase-3 subunit delta
MRLSVTPEDAVQEALAGKLRPVYLVMGEERWFTDRVVTALRQAVSSQGIAGFNEDKFTAGESSIGAILSASKMLPMMAKKRLVLVRGLDRWEKKDEDGDAGDTGKKGKVQTPLDELAEYAKAPVDSTVMVLVAGKLHGQRRLVTGAKKGGYVVTCEPLDRRALPPWIKTLAKDKGHAIAADAAEQLAELSGSELSYLADAIERLSLYVGPNNPITEEAVTTLVTRIAQSSVWELIDALGRRQTGRALALIADVFDPREGGLRMLGAVGWSVRQLVKLDGALREGLSQNEAAQRAGVAPFKVNELRETLRALPPGALATWMRALADADLALKGSRRPAQAILETMVLEMSR